MGEFYKSNWNITIVPSNLLYVGLTLHIENVWENHDFQNITHQWNINAITLKLEDVTVDTHTYNIQVAKGNGYVCAWNN